MESRCILITGVGHSGTRLLVQMLRIHPDISVPDILNDVEEFLPLHRFFIQSMDRTPLHASEYNIDYDELRFIMDAYMSRVDSSRPSFVFKMPYYPLNLLEFYNDYFGDNVTYMYSHRPVKKIQASFDRKGEIDLFFNSHTDEIMRQVKKLPLEKRAQYLASGDGFAFFDELTRHSLNLVNQWNKQHPENPFIDIDIEKIMQRDYLTQLLGEMNVSVENIDEMISAVNVKRLIKGKQDASNRSQLAGYLRQLTPPIIWSQLQKLKRNR